MASGDSRMVKPLRPSVTSSAAQEPSISTLASPQAAASRTTSPLVSKVEGKRNRSARVFQARRTSRS